MNSYVFYETTIGTSKPNTLNRNGVCPFCNRTEFKKENGVLDEDGPFLLVENKFPTFKNCLQTVLVESYDCEKDLSNYSKEHLFATMKFAIKNWKKLSDSGEFKSVTLIKNHGVVSGGSIYHPHMQIVGYQDLDYKEHVHMEHFEGLPIFEDDGVLWNVSNQPRTEFYEFNIVMKNPDGFEKFCLSLQKTVYYILNSLNLKHKSYNLCFYEIEGQIFVKIFSRFPNSSFFLGYSISQLPDNLHLLQNDLKSMVDF